MQLLLRQHNSKQTNNLTSWVDSGWGAGQTRSHSKNSTAGLRQPTGGHHAIGQCAGVCGAVKQRPAPAALRTFLTPSVWFSIWIRSVRESDGTAATSDQLDLVRRRPISARISPKSSGASSSSISDKTESGVPDLATADWRDIVSTQDAEGNERLG